MNLLLNVLKENPLKKLLIFLLCFVSNAYADPLGDYIAKACFQGAAQLVLARDQQSQWLTGSVKGFYRANNSEKWTKKIAYFKQTSIREGECLLINNENKLMKKLVNDVDGTLIIT